MQVSIEFVWRLCVQWNRIESHIRYRANNTDMVTNLMRQCTMYIYIYLVRTYILYFEADSIPPIEMYVAFAQRKKEHISWSYEARSI